MFYSSESDLKSNQSAINHFYENTLVKSYLTTPCGKLFYAYAKPNNAQAAIVISSGRVEGLEKYKELLWELYNNNYAVFIIDHQGQGRSYRHLKNKHKGYVKSFNNYIFDLKKFNLQVVDIHWQGKKILLGHSMGAAIAFNYLASIEHNFNGGFLSAPMFDIHTPNIPRLIIKLITNTARLFGFQYSYAFGQKNYLPIEFSKNTLTSSKIRYSLFKQAYQQEPTLQLGGVTYGWLYAAFRFMSSIKQLSVSIPLYIASAKNDKVVDNNAQYQIANSHSNITLESFANADHELLFERDEIRKPVLKSFYTFCEKINY